MQSDGKAQRNTADNYHKRFFSEKVKEENFKKPKVTC